MDRPISDHTLDVVLEQLLVQRGLALGSFQRSFVATRVRRRMSHVGFVHEEDYLTLVRESPPECDALVDALAVNVSRFFRDPPVFDYISEVVLPERLEARRSAGSAHLRIWSAGCGSGEEPYSLAICLEELLRGENEGVATHLFATDIDRRALREADAARYARASLVDTRLGIVDRYFRAHGQKLVLADSIRARVHFSEDDVGDENRVAPAGAVYGDFDLLCCRNVLIYFRRSTQQRVIRKLVRALAPGGHLVLGRSETLPAERAFGLEPVGEGLRIYRRIGGSHGDDTRFAAP